MLRSDCCNALNIIIILAISIMLFSPGRTQDSTEGKIILHKAIIIKQATL